MQIPIAGLKAKNGIIGVWSSVDRRKVTTRTTSGASSKGAWIQVNRLANPLVNEVVIPTGLKDQWNGLVPWKEGRFRQYYDAPILAAVINKLYKLGAPENDRDDLVAVLLTGVPNLNFTTPRLAELLRLNLTIPVTKNPNRMGVLAGDNQGWPNGRRLNDDVIDIAEQAVGGFLKGTKLPLGDGVNGDDRQLLDPSRIADPQEGFDNTKAEIAPRRDRSGACARPIEPRRRIDANNGREAFVAIVAAVLGLLAVGRGERPRSATSRSTTARESRCAGGDITSGTHSTSRDRPTSSASEIALADIAFASRRSSTDFDGRRVQLRVVEGSLFTWRRRSEDARLDVDMPALLLA